MIVVLIFLAVDATVYDDRMARVRVGHEAVLDALGVFARGTCKYFGVATVFGGIVAVLDGAVWLFLGIPAAGLWALLALVINYKISDDKSIVTTLPFPCRRLPQMA